jgi:uncharacterized protein YybS (DUF2232 family)
MVDQTSRTENVVVPTREAPEEKFFDRLRASWWLALILAIPISIVANLLTPNVEHWLSQRSESAARQALKEAETERKRIEILRSDKSQLTALLTATVVKVAVYTAILGIFNFPVSLFVQQMMMRRFSRGVGLLSLQVLQMLFNIVVFLLIINTCRAALSTYEQVNQVDADTTQIGPK